MRYNSVLGAFTFFVVAIFIALLVFIQTETFGRVLSRVVADISYRKTETRIKFGRIKMNLFPPGIYLQDVYLKKKIDPETTILAEFGEMGLSLLSFQIEDRSFGLSEIIAKDSVLELRYPPQNEKTTEIPQEKIDEIFTFIQKTPLWLSAINAENLRLITTHQLLDAKKIRLDKKKDKLRVKFQISSLAPSEKNNYSVDEIWGDFIIDRKKIKINKAKIQHEVQSLLIKGEVEDYSKLLNATARFNGEGYLHFAHLQNLYPALESIKVDKGIGHISFNGSIKDSKLSGKTDLFIKDLSSNLLDCDEMFAAIEIQEDIIHLKKLNFKKGGEKISLLRGANLFNYKTKKLQSDELELELEGVDLRNMLKFVPALKVLGATISGLAKIRLDERGVDISLSDNFDLENFVFEVGDENPFKILGLKKAKLLGSKISIRPDQFFIETSVRSGHSILNLKGRLDKNRVDFFTEDSIVNFKDFGNISNLNIEGEGPLDIKVSGPNNDVVIDLKGKTENFGILGYKLGKSREDISIYLKDSLVNINDLEATFKSTPISGTGSVNYKNSDISIGINSSRANYTDLKEILDPIFSNLNFLPPDLDFNSRIDAQIYGKTNLKDLKIKSEVKFKDANIYGEGISVGSTKIILNNENFQIKEFLAEIGKGQIQGDFSFNLNSKKMDFELDWDDISLQRLRIIKRLNLNLDGVLDGSINGTGNLSNYTINLDNKLTKTSNSEHNYPDSIVQVGFTPKNIFGDIRIFKDAIKTSFDYSLLGSRPSWVKLALNINDLKPFALAFFGEHLKSEDFNGEFLAEIQASSSDSLKDISLTGFIKKLKLNHDQFVVNYIADSPQFLIEKDNVKKWNLNIDSPDIKIQSKGRGRFSENVLLSNQLQLNSKILEIFLRPVLSAEGFLNNSFIISGSGKNFEILAKSESENLNLTLEHVPVPLNEMKYKIEFLKKKLIVKEMRANIENGSASIVGEVYFDDFQPDVNLKYQLDKAEFPFMGKSFVNLSGQGMILGDSLPYSLSGEIVLNKCQVLNELNDFSSKSPVTAQSRFLPQGLESPLSKLFNLNLRLKTDNPIRIANSLMDVSLKGELSVEGHLERMRGQGRLTSLPGQSKIFFKNNEYLITQADLNFDSKKEIKNPDFDIHAITTISNYKINSKAYGNLERFNFDLTSEPSLPRNSILSLIAFGYSDEIQSSLTQSQQQNLTQVGVGSFVFDRFKISDILNKQFGLQVNLGTVFEQSQTASLLTGRNQDGQGTLGRTRTATKIELKKRLDDALNLSVSSTMGGSIGQRQSMNLNYSLTKKVQLEGVYELRTNAEGEEDIIDNSIGGDLKFRWTFK